MTRETRKGSSRSEANEGRSPLAALLRAHDRDRYQTALFAPADRREPLFVLYAFNYEIARVREIVTQPMLGQIRLQWWREVVADAFGGLAPRQHELAAPLAAVIARNALTRAHFDRMIDTRERDLADEPPADLAALEEYAEGTSATLLYLALEALGAAEPAARAAARAVGTGYALVGLLRAMPFHARAGRSYLPAEIVGHSGLDPADYANLRASPALRAATAEIAEAAAGHLQRARRDRRAVPRSARAALLSAIIAERFLARLKRAACNPFAPELAAPDPLQSWRLLAAHMSGRFSSY